MPHRLSVVVADHDLASQRRVVEAVSSETHFDVVAHCSHGGEAVDAIRTYRPDLIVIDIETPDIDGFSVVSQVQRELPSLELPAVIFLTSVDRYALKAFDCKAIDYVLKPFTKERIQQALQRAKTFVVQRQMHDVEDRLRGILQILNGDSDDASRVRGELEACDVLRRIGIRTGDRWSVIQAAEIDWIAGAGVYAKIVVGENSHLLRASLSELERRLDPGRFVRIHRSTIVNITRVSEVRLHGHGEYVLVLNDGTELKVSRSYSDRLRDSIDKLG